MRESISFKCSIDCDDDGWLSISEFFFFFIFKLKNEFVLKIYLVIVIPKLITTLNVLLNKWQNGKFSALFIIINF